MNSETGIELLDEVIQTMVCLGKVESEVSQDPAFRALCLILGYKLRSIENAIDDIHSRLELTGLE